MNSESENSYTNHPAVAARTDIRDVPVSACDPKSLDAYEIALHQLQSYVGDPIETMNDCLQADPEFVMGHLLTANGLLMMTERQYGGQIRASLGKAEALASKANDREKRIMLATRQNVDGHWDKAARTWDAVLADYPRDALAIQCGHLMDFFIGDASNLRDRIGRVIGHWDPDMPGYSYILGMHAFGLEESNEFSLAEETARAALAIERRDGWSVHALTHVMEMQNRFEEGQKLLRSTVDDWAPNNAFAYHNWWHLALMHLEQNDFSSALELFDKQISPCESDVSFENIDASALLWRIHLQGRDVNARWITLADAWQKKLPGENGYYAFNDFHAVLALAGAGRLDQARQVLEALKLVADQRGTATAIMARDVGIPACSAIIAFAESRYQDAIDYIYPIRSTAHKFGGSNAQRDILTQTLIESALRANQVNLAQSLVSERDLYKATSPLTEGWRERLAA